MCQDQSLCQTVVAMDVASVPRSRHHLRDWLDGLGWPPAGRDDVLLAVGEAVTNAIEHSGHANGTAGEQPGPGAKSVAVTASVEDHDRYRRVRVRIVDHGRWREPGDDPTRSRFGIPFMYGLMEKVTIVRDLPGTEVTLLSPFVPAI